MLEASDGAEALVLARSEHPDLVITDILMPTMDGFEFTQRLRADASIAKTKIIFYTATYRVREADILAKACDVQWVLAKPSDPEKILTTVSQALGLPSPPASQPLQSDSSGVVDDGRAGMISNRLAKYMEDLQSLHHEMTGLIKRGHELVAERDHLREMAAELSQSLGSLQSVSLRLAALIELGMDLASHRDRFSLLATFCRGAHNILSCKYAVLGMLDEEGETLAFLLTHGLDPDSEARIRPLPPRAGILGQLMDERRARRANNLGGDLRVLGLPTSHPPIDSFLGVAVYSGTHVYGWLYLADRLGAAEFSEDDERLAVTIAAQLAIVYESVGLYDDLQRHSARLELEVAERKRAEEQLRDSEERYRLLFQNNPQPAWVADLDKLSFLAVNDAAVRQYGYSREEFLAMSIKDICPAEDVPELLRIVSQLTGADQTGVQARHKRKDGTIIDAELTTFELTFKGRRARVVIANDMTERKCAERRLAAQHAATRALAESATLEEASPKILKTICDNLAWDMGGIWKVDARARLLRCVEIWHGPSLEFSEFAAASRALTFASGVGLPGHVWSSRQPAWISDVRVDSIFSSGRFASQKGLHGAIAFPILAGHEVLGVIEFLSHEIRQPDNDLLQMFSSIGTQIGQFIERKNLEEQFLQAQKMEAVGRLAGGIAHDFNNLMTAVLGYSDLLLLGMKKDDPAKADIEEIRKAGDRATSLTRQLLAFSRQQVIELKVLNLNEVVVSIDKMLRRVIGEDIDLVTIPDPRLGSVKVDPTQIEQVLMNLVVNARDAMPEGGKLTIEMRNVDLDATYTRDHAGVQPGPYVMLAVSDTGVGMDAETQRHIFEPFFTTKVKGQGTGLGLATVFGIVQQSGGNIGVYSELGSGTTFKIYLPRVEEAAEAVVVEKAMTGSLRGSETILLVEDEAAVRKLARRILESKGYTVLQADNAEQATVLSKQHKRPIDLLLTDIVLTDVSGPKLADQLRSTRSDMKALYMSGYTDEAVVRTGMLNAGTAFLQKPFTPELLLRKVREVLG